MDAWEFFARSEWPLVVAGALWVFRRPIERKLESTVKASGLGLSFEFSGAIAKAEALISSWSTSSSSDDKAALPSDKATSEMVILDAWRLLVDRITRASGSQPATAWLWNTSQFDEAAERLGLTSDEVAALRELRAIRDQVAHTVGAPITATEAERFKQITQRLIQRLTQK